jgi:hypothetical protein
MTIDEREAPWANDVIIERVYYRIYLQVTRILNIELYTSKRFISLKLFLVLAADFRILNSRIDIENLLPYRFMQDASLRPA